MSFIVPLRLNKAEIAMLKEILSSEHCEAENRSEWFRLLLHREWNKRKGLGVPVASSYQTSFRVSVPSPLVPHGGEGLQTDAEKIETK